MKKFLIASGVAVLAFASVAAAQTFNANLTVGSTGSDVVALQTALISGGYSIPAIASGAASKGYFGSQTKAAVMAYQAAHAVPSTGFVGPLTRAALNGGAMAVVPVGFVCPAGYSCTANPGTTPVVVNPGTAGITTPGVEGTLAATQTNSGLVSTAYEGDSMIGILGVKLDAKNSDISVQRVKLALGTDTKIYNKIFSKIYVTDGTNVLASADLNSSTVIKDAGTYYITIAGFNYVIPKNSSKNIVVKADVRSTVDSVDLGSYTVTFAASGVRGVDGAGIDQYAAGTSISRSTTVSASLSDSATLKISTNSSTVKSADVVAAAGSAENEYDRLTVLSFDLKAEKDNVKITDLSIDVTKNGTGAATASTSVYLYDGSTELDSSPVVNGTATFPDIDYVIARDTTKTFTVQFRRLPLISILQMS
jgi:peptidoglycan hydrolase-like protein with peptidoglycan-binding domain